MHRKNDVVTFLSISYLSSSSKYTLSISIQYMSYDVGNDNFVVVQDNRDLEIWGQEGPDGNRSGQRDSPSPVQIMSKIPMFSMRRHIGQDGIVNETRTEERWLESFCAHAQLNKLTSSSRPSSFSRGVLMSPIAPACIWLFCTFFSLVRLAILMYSFDEGLISINHGSLLY